VNDLTREELISIVLSQQEQLAAVDKEMGCLRSTVERLEKENAELRARLGGDGNAPIADLVKPNRAERRAAEREERKKRKESFVRKRDIATREVRHSVDICANCGGRLKGGWVVSTRQTIEIPHTPVAKSVFSAYLRFANSTAIVFTRCGAIAYSQAISEPDTATIFSGKPL